MNMILVCADLWKLYLVAVFNAKTNFLENRINLLVKNNTSVFCRENQVI